MVFKCLFDGIRASKLQKFIKCSRKMEHRCGSLTGAGFLLQNNIGHVLLPLIQESHILNRHTTTKADSQVAATQVCFAQITHSHIPFFSHSLSLDSVNSRRSILIRRFYKTQSQVHKHTAMSIITLFTSEIQSHSNIASNMMTNNSQ